MRELEGEILDWPVLCCILPRNWFFRRQTKVFPSINRMRRIADSPSCQEGVNAGQGACKLSTEPQVNGKARKSKDSTGNGSEQRCQPYTSRNNCKFVLTRTPDG